jgi:hypothetical protein
VKNFKENFSRAKFLSRFVHKILGATKIRALASFHFAHSCFVANFVGGLFAFSVVDHSLHFMIRSRSWDQSLDSAPFDQLSTSKSSSEFYDPLRYSNSFVSQKFFLLLFRG